jgi:ANTAR domain
MTSPSLRAVAEMFADLGRQLSAATNSTDSDAALEQLTALAVRAVANADAASISRAVQRAPRGFETIAATSELPMRVDGIQYEEGHGPCVDAVVQNTVFCTGDLRSDPRWPEFGRRAAVETGVLSMLSYRLFLEDDDLLASLNVYSTMSDAFDEHAEAVGTLVATLGALEVNNARRRDKIHNLQKALASNRDIGVAMGVLMARHKITREQAFDLLRVASQHTHRKLSDIAAEVADTGALDLPRDAMPSLQAGRRVNREQKVTVT